MKQRSVLYEIPVFYLLLLGLERGLFPERAAFYGVSPHPYWLGVLVFGLRYGLAAGVASGGVSALLYLGGMWVGGDRFHFEDADFYLLPGLFVLLGAVIGGVVDRLKDGRSAALAETERVKERNKALRNELEVQHKANRAVEQQVVSQMSSLVTLYQGARNLGTLERKELLHGILDFFAAALKAEKAALHLLESDRWKLLRSRGWDDSDPYPKELDVTQGIIGKAGSENRVVSLRDWFGTNIESAWKGRSKADAVLAGPLRRDTGEVIGVFSVQDMPLLRFNSASVNLLTLLVDWAETSISKCLYFEELKSKLILDEVYNVYNERYFKSRTQQEFSRSRTYALPFSILLVGVEGIKSLSRDRQVNVLRALGRLLQDTARDIDIVTKCADSDIPFAVLMMTATAERAGELRADIFKACGKLDLLKCGKDGEELALKVGVGSYAAKMSSTEDIVAQAREDLK